MAAIDSKTLEGVDNESTIVRVEQLRVAFGASGKNLIAGIIAALIIAIAASNQHVEIGSIPVGYIWFGILTLGLLRGLLLTRRFVKLTASDDPPAVLRFGRSLTLNGAFCALVWGSSSWFLLPTGSLEGDAFIILAIAMVLMGAAGAQAAYRPLVLTFNLLVTTVFVSGLARFPDQFHVLMIIAFCIYCAVTMMSATSQGASVKKQLLLQLEKQRLVRAADDARGLAETERNAANVARKNAEEARSAAEITRRMAELATLKAVEADRAKTTLLASASHDLRQPLHSLRIFVADLTERNTDRTLSNTVRRINSSVEAMTALLDSILEFSLLSLNQVTPRLRTFDASDVLARLDDRLRPVATDKGLRFIMKPRDVRAPVKTDEGLLEGILQNLILNAIRYTDSGRILVRCKRNKNVLSFQVWDTGIGIPRNELTRIYDAFFQIGNNARDRKKGLGLGLAIVRELCRLLNLRLRVRSVVSKGTVFLLEVPISEEPILKATSQESNEAAQDYVKGAFVILIEDNDANRDATAFALRRMQCQVLAAASTAEMLEKLQRQEFIPHLIVTDYRLGPHSGVDAINILTENLKAAHGINFTIPALIVSGDATPEALKTVSDAGYEMLHKPVHPATLYEAVNRLLKIAMESSDD